MELRRSLAIARHDLRILRGDSAPLVLLVVMPLVVMPFVASAFRYTVAAQGIPHATGAEQAVPGMAVTFAFFLVGSVSFGFFREHAWRTWERLRASPATAGEILLGKVLVPLGQAGVQAVLLFALGGLLLHLHVRGSLLGLALVAAAFSLCLVAIGLALTAVCRTVMQLNVVTNIAALLLAGLGGAFVPEATLPHWAKLVSPAVPSYWAMRGYRRVIDAPGGLGAVLVSVAVLLAFAGAAAAVAALRLRFGETKTTWA